MHHNLSLVCVLYFIRKLLFRICALFICQQSATPTIEVDLFRRVVLCCILTIDGHDFGHPGLIGRRMSFIRRRCWHYTLRAGRDRTDSGRVGRSDGNRE